MPVKRAYKWLGLTVSAFLLNIAFFVPYYADWLVFVFLIPLFVTVLFYELSWKEGFYWGVLFFTGHWYGFFLVIKESGHGSYRLLLVPALIIYGALQSSWWFASASWVDRHYCRQLTSKIIVWCLITFCYFLWLYKGLLIIFGSCLGYCFGLPLIPLAQHPQWLQLLPTLTWYGLLLCLMCSSMAIAVAIFKRTFIWLLIAVPWYIPFMYGWIVPKQSSIPSYIQILGYVKPTRMPASYPLDCAQQLSNAIGELIERRPEITIVVLPESSFPFPLNEHQQLIGLITNADFKDDLSIVLGAHCTHNENCYNTMYMLQDMCITGSYDKNYLMPLTEYVPYPWNLFSWANDLFLKEKKEFVSQNGICRLITINNQVSFVPLICSDLFLAPSNPNNGLPALCIVNDSWFSMASLRHLMLLYARFKALEARQDMIYCGHYGGFWLGKSGEIIVL